MTGEEIRTRSSGRLSLPAGAPLAEGLAASFTGVLRHACAQAAAADPVAAVHEYRKSVRRARALLRLCRSVLDADAYAQLRAALRSAHRATSQQRDSDVLVQTLEGLDLDDELPGIAERARALSAPATTETPAHAEIHAAAAQRLRDGIVLLEPLPGRLATALPKKVAWRQVQREIRRTYRQARQAFHQAFHTGHEEAIHDWRKRTKELGYQIEFLVHDVPRGRSHKLGKRLGALAQRLGSVVDLLVLDQWGQAHLSEREQRRLARAIAEEHKQRLSRALKRGARLFDSTPREFARQLVEQAREAHKQAREAHKLARKARHAAPEV